MNPDEIKGIFVNINAAAMIPNNGTAANLAPLLIKIKIPHTTSVTATAIITCSGNGSPKCMNVFANSWFIHFIAPETMNT